MKFITAFLIACLLIAPPAFARGGGAVPTPCVASPPTQASALGITHQVLCDNFATNQGVDANNTQQPGYKLYPASPIIGTIPVTTKTLINNNGTGLSLSGSVA